MKQKLTAMTAAAHAAVLGASRRAVRRDLRRRHHAGADRVYVLTARVLDREVDAVIQARSRTSSMTTRRGGLLQLIATLRRRADSWGRSGAVYLLIEPNGYPHRRQPRALAARRRHLRQLDRIRDRRQRSRRRRLASGARAGVPAARRPAAARRHRHSRTPAARLAAAHRDVLGRRARACCSRRSFGFSYSRRIRRRVSAFASTCESIMAGDLSQRLPVEGSHDEFDELGARGQSHARTHRAADRHAAHDVRQRRARPARRRCIARVCASKKSLQHDGLSDDVARDDGSDARRTRTRAANARHAAADRAGRRPRPRRADRSTSILQRSRANWSSCIDPKPARATSRSNTAAPRPRRLRGNQPAARAGAREPGRERHQVRAAPADAST